PLLRSLPAFPTRRSSDLSADGGSVARALPAIDVKGLSGHERGRFEIKDGVHDVGDLAHSAERVEAAERIMRLDGMHRRLDDARRDRKSTRLNSSHGSISY